MEDQEKQQRTSTVSNTTEGLQQHEVKQKQGARIFGQIWKKAST